MSRLCAAAKCNFFAQKSSKQQKPSLHLQHSSNIAWHLEAQSLLNIYILIWRVGHILRILAVHVVQETVERKQVADQLAKQQRKALLLQQVHAVLTFATGSTGLHCKMLRVLFG